MLSFKEFINEAEVKASKRQGMKHFHDMKPAEFINWIQSVKKEMGGILGGIKTVLKVDGLGFRFGKSESGQPFVEGSRTGPIFDSGAFSAHATSKGAAEEILVRARHYDDMLELFKKSKLMKVLPNDSKVYCEVFYNPMAEEDELGLKFVTVKYDKSKLGSLMTVLPYGVMVASTGEIHPDSDTIITKLLGASDNKTKVIDPSLKMSSIDINGIIDPIQSLDKDAERIVQSRKKDDKEARENIISIINRVKEDLYQHIIFNKNIAGLEKLCKPEDNEGICLYLPHGTFKMTSRKFQETHHGASK